ncbi:GNAT family N-acetyltransferase [Leptothoe sp. PORK10 BA2]|uniref:GNAT family N-acetyltransferase n=1 Tax=Leptothoe sp. PORK10 BA2 TaxID=3110254 RepID=UPI002B1FAEC7|nr:GNAT family N-acetyltransferase [Leptothoe sp. PORK10 BA2]MEA5466948.1 GNAT family N-acetyltransferase [Leptothoe sp. PORK10 BA2]
MKLPVAFTLRQASVSDATLLYDLIDRTMRGFIVTTWGAWSESRVQAESREDISSPNAQVISVGDVSVGVFIVERHPTHIHLDSLYLLPEYQRLGIGTALINSLITEARQNKVPIRLRVIAVNPAKKFYEQFGFIVTEATSEFFFMEKLT